MQSCQGIRFTQLNGKCSKIVNTFLFLFSNKLLVFRAGSHKIFVKIANRVCAVCLGICGRQLVFEILEIQSNGVSKSDKMAESVKPDQNAPSGVV